MKAESRQEYERICVNTRRSNRETTRFKVKRVTKADWLRIDIKQVYKIQRQGVVPATGDKTKSSSSRTASTTHDDLSAVRSDLNAGKRASRGELERESESLFGWCCALVRVFMTLA